MNAVSGIFSVMLSSFWLLVRLCLWIVVGITALVLNMLWGFVRSRSINVFFISV